MFNELSVVSTAVSSFNNAALFSPYFFTVALFSLPLFYIVYLYAHDILARLKWNNDIEQKTSFWCALLLVGWVLMFGGNYAVIRDGISLLPMAIASVLFVSVIYVVQQAKKQNYLGFLKNKKARWLTAGILLILTVFSAKPDLFGILLQLSAIVCGVIVGSRLHKNISSVPFTTVVLGIMTALILMQPEFFRFGQLGNLTFVHLLSLLITGFFAVTVLVVKYTNARAKIYQSAYIKLKWLCRILGFLALVLFGLTESVPVFAGLLAIVAISEMLTVYHSKKKSDVISKRSWALLLMCFGALIMCPVISCLGILYLSKLPDDLKVRDFYALL